MDKIALLHSSQAFPFIDYMNKTGMRTAQLLKRARLPVALLEHAEGFIVENKLWLLLDLAAKQDNMHDFGLRVGDKINIEQLLGNLLPHILTQPTLHEVLNRFCELVSKESSGSQFRISHSPNSGKYWFCRGGVPGIQIGEQNAELYTLMLMIKLVRLVVGNGWHPTHIHLKTNDTRSFRDWDIFRYAVVLVNQPATAIEVPAFIPNPYVAARAKEIIFQGRHTAGARVRNLSANDFSTSLSLVIDMYLPHQHLDINAAADVVGLSTRTLQRRLAKEATAYSEIIDKIRFKYCLPLLGDKNNKLIDIAYDLGYSDPAHFSRAFKRWAGISPREYRRNLVSWK